MKFKNKKLKKDYLRRYLYNINEIEEITEKAIKNNSIIPLNIRNKYLQLKGSEEKLESFNKDFKGQKWIIKTNEQKKNKIKNIINKDKSFFFYIGGINRQKNNLYYLTKIRNKCIKTGRTRGVITKLGISRLVFRELVENGYIPGYEI